MQSLIDDLSNADGMAFSKKDNEMSEATREALIISLENALRIAKIEAKKNTHLKNIAIKGVRCLCIYLKLITKLISW